MKNKLDKTILIVEDEFFLAETIRARLEFLGYDVAYAENGLEALQLLEITHIDLILMDVMMPVMDGYAATERIKADEKLKKIPVIFLTARAGEEDKKRAFETGADDYLAKPFRSEDLIAMIEKWISKNNI
ncbi:MAG: response regulator [Deltaproteobacteria bacterium]|nr:response regulator [Deltaproteobacteria bacterium]